MRGQHKAVPLPPRALDALASRGIGPGFRGNPRSQNAGITNVVYRLDRLGAIHGLEERLGRESHQLVLALLSDPWTLSASDIEVLPTLLLRALQRPGVELPPGLSAEAFLEQVESLDYADRLALVTSAEQHHAGKV